MVNLSSGDNTVSSYIKVKEYMEYILSKKNTGFS